MRFAPSGTRAWAGLVRILRGLPLFGAQGPCDVATFSGVTALYRAGSWDVTATDTQSGITSAAFVNVQAAPEVALQVVAPGNATSGVAFDVTVLAVDPHSNTDSNYTGTVTFSSGRPAGVGPRRTGAPWPLRLPPRSNPPPAAPG